MRRNFASVARRQPRVAKALAVAQGSADGARDFTPDEASGRSIRPELMPKVYPGRKVEGDSLNFS